MRCRRRLTSKYDVRFSALRIGMISGLGRVYCPEIGWKIKFDDGTSRGITLMIHTLAFINV